MSRKKFLKNIKRHGLQYLEGANQTYGTSTDAVVGSIVKATEYVFDSNLTFAERSAISAEADYIAEQGIDLRMPTKSSFFEVGVNSDLKNEDDAVIYRLYVYVEDCPDDQHLELVMFQVNCDDPNAIRFVPIGYALDWAGKTAKAFSAYEMSEFLEEEKLSLFFKLFTQVMPYLSAIMIFSRVKNYPIKRIKGLPVQLTARRYPKNSKVCIQLGVARHLNIGGIGLCLPRRKMRRHCRRGHPRLQRYGYKRRLVKEIYIESYDAGHAEEGSIDHLYEVVAHPDPEHKQEPVE